MSARSWGYFAIVYAAATVLLMMIQIPSIAGIEGAKKVLFYDAAALALVCMITGIVLVRKSG